MSCIPFCCIPFCCIPPKPGGEGEWLQHFGGGQRGNVPLCMARQLRIGSRWGTRAPAHPCDWCWSTRTVLLRKPSQTVSSCVKTGVRVSREGRSQVLSWGGGRGRVRSR